MNLSEQQQSSSTQHPMAIFPTEAQILANADTTLSSEERAKASSESPVAAPYNPLALLEIRLTNMANTISTLKNKVSMLNKVVSDREAHIRTIAQENADLDQQLASFSNTHSQMVDGLAEMLNRFPENFDVIETTEEGLISVDNRLLDQTVGSA